MLLHLTSLLNKTANPEKIKSFIILEDIQKNQTWFYFQKIKVTITQRDRKKFHNFYEYNYIFNLEGPTLSNIANMNEICKYKYYD